MVKKRYKKFIVKKVTIKCVLKNRKVFRKNFHDFGCINKKPQ